MKTTTDITLGTGANPGTISAAGMTAPRTATLPDKSGTVAMLSDLSAGSANPVATLWGAAEFGAF